MSIIDIRARHKLDFAAAQQAADDLAADLAKKFDIDYGWDRNVIHFERAGVSGTIKVGKRDIHIKASLGFLLTMLQGRIEQEITEYLQNHFGCTFES